MVAPTDANASIGSTYLIPGYDPNGHQYKVAVRVNNLQTDTSISPNMVYGDLVMSLPSGIVLSSEYPVGATPVGNSSGVVANAVATAILPATANKTTYLKGFSLTGSGATVGLPVAVTISNLLIGTLSFIYTATAGALLANTPLFIPFEQGLPAVAQNTTIVVSCPALGLGNLNNVVNAWGYQL